MWKSYTKSSQTNWKSAVSVFINRVVGRFVKEIPLQFLCSAGELQGRLPACTRLYKAVWPGLVSTATVTMATVAGSPPAAHTHPIVKSRLAATLLPRNLALLLNYNTRVVTPPSKHTSWFNSPYRSRYTVLSHDIAFVWPIYLCEKATCLNHVLVSEQYAN